MKNHLVVIFVLASITYLVSNGWAEDLEDGFMGYIWGSDISQYSGLKQLYTKGGLRFYSNPGESYVIEDMTIGDVIYGFYKDKFYAVYINLDSLDKYDMIERQMKARYGMPDYKASSKENLVTRKWKYKDIHIKLKTDQVKGRMKVAFYHEPTSRGLEQERRLFEIENSDRFFPIDKNKNIDMVPFLEFYDNR